MSSLDDFHKAARGLPDPAMREVMTEFGTALFKLRERQDEYDRALKSGRADPLVKAQLERMEADLNALHRKTNRPHIASVSSDAPSVMETKANKEFGRWKGGVESKAARDRYAEVFEKYLRLDNKGAIVGDELKTLSVGSSPDGGFYVEPFRAQTMVTKLYETSDLRRVAPAISISSNTYTEPIDRDEPTTGWVGEQTSRPQTATPQIGMLSIPVHELYSEPAATQNILDDAGINVEDWLAQKVADEMGREENKQFVNGNGVSKPKGFLSYSVATTADSSRAFGTLQYIFTGVAGGFKALAAGPPIVQPADDLFKLIYAFKAGYRRNLRWAGTRVTLSAVRTMKDLQGQYIYVPQISANGIIDTVLGYPWDEFADMPDYTTTDALGIALADWSRGYLIVDRTGIRVLRDPFSAKPYVLFYTTKRVGGAVRDSDAIKFLKFGTS